MRVDIERRRKRPFYLNTPWMKEISFGSGRKALKFSSQKINRREAGREIESQAPRQTPGAIDLCLVTRTPLDTVSERIKSCGVDVIDGPVAGTGAVGPIRSVYVRDPDGNLVEICNGIGERQACFATNRAPPC